MKMIKNKQVVVKGGEYNDITGNLVIKELSVIITNDDKGKTLSVDNGVIQFSIPMDKLMKYLK